MKQLSLNRRKSTLQSALLCYIYKNSAPKYEFKMHSRLLVTSLAILAMMPFLSTAQNGVSCTYGSTLDADGCGDGSYECCEVTDTAVSKDLLGGKNGVCVKNGLNCADVVTAISKQTTCSKGLCRWCCIFNPNLGGVCLSAGSTCP